MRQIFHSLHISSFTTPERRFIGDVKSILQKNREREKRVQKSAETGRTSASIHIRHDAIKAIH